MARRFTGRSYSTIGDGEVEVLVDWEITPGDPGCRYMNNGDPGYPPEPAEVEITAAWIVFGNPITLDAEDEERICNQILEEDHEPDDPDPDAGDLFFERVTVPRDPREQDAR